MKVWIRAIFLVVLVLVQTSGPAFADRFRVTKVYDGDTLKAETPDLVIYVMLVGIDAPEIAQRSGQPDQPFGREAKKFLSDLLLNRTVVVEGYGTLPYPDKDLIGVIYLRGRNINLEMVKRGLAEVQRENLPDEFDIRPYLAAEAEAKAAGRGMWALGDKYVSPAVWRRTHQWNCRP